MAASSDITDNKTVDRRTKKDIAYKKIKTKLNVKNVPKIIFQR